MLTLDLRRREESTLNTTFKEISTLCGKEKIMKIIKIDNFGRESVADKLIAENVRGYWSGLIVELLNNYEGADSPNFFKLVEDDYVLWRGMAELV